MIGRPVALALLFCAFTATGHGAAAGTEQLRTTRAVIQPGAGEETEFRFRADGDGQAILRLYGPDWHQVRELSVEGIARGETVSLRWDGTGEDGAPLPDEAYFPVVEFFGNDGQAHAHDPSVERALGPVLVQNPVYDAEAGGIRFSLQVPARVTILVGIDGGGPLMATLLSGVPYPAGDHLLPWDGMDQSGVLELAAEKRFRIFASARELWPDSVILRGSPAGPYHLFSAALAAEGLPTKEPPSIEEFGGAPHLLPGPEDISPEPVFSLAVAGHEGDGIPEVSGEVPLVVSLGEEVKVPVLARRFEIVLFHDYEFTTEVEEGRSPATIVWDAAKLPPGRYLVTVNVATLPGQMSAASMYVDLK